MAKLKDLKKSVVIDNGFPGTYTYRGGTSYYLNGITGAGEIHFSINGSDNTDFTKFHVTYSVGGSNVGIWFIGDTFSNPPNLQNLPSSKMEDWKTWWANNKSNVVAAAQEFWTKVHPS